ncbi:MAG: hypothetical protein ACREQJ_05630 [Candidatus Binatia bacterium]
MFEIDLKRGSQRSSGGDWKADFFESARPWLPVAGMLAGVLVALWIVGGRLEREVEERRARVADLDKTVAEKRTELASLAGQRGTLAALSTKEIYWSDLLRLVSEKIPDKLWLTEVKIVTSTPPKDEPNAPVHRMLQLHGGVLSAASEGNLDVIAKFIETLQGDPRYKDVFGEAKLQSVTRGASGDPYTLGFLVTAPFLPA